MKCRKCNKELDESFFYNSGNYKGKSYKRTVCKNCGNKERNPYQNKYRKINKDIINEKRRAYYKKRMSILEVKETVNEGQRRRHCRYVIKRLWKNAKNRALKNNIQFTITEEDILIPVKCPLLNVTLQTGTKYDYNNSPSLDRIDNTKGYIKENIWVISTLANTMKNKATLEQLLLFASNINKHFNSKDIVRTIENKESIEL